MENDALLKVDDLNVELDGQSIIEHLSFTAKKGEIITVLGPNGAGKTVLLRCLLGVLPYRGKIEWKQDVKIGYVPQRLPFIKDIPLSVADFFALKKADKQEVGTILKASGLKEDLLKRKIGDLSSGQFQRVLILWSLIGNPEILLFDEPTTGVDISGEENIYHFIRELQEKKKLTTILVTHDLNVVYEYSTFVLCLNKKNVCSGQPRDVLTGENLQKLYGTEIKLYQHKHS